MALRYIAGIAAGSFFTLTPLVLERRMVLTIAIILLFLSAEWLGRKNGYAIEILPFNKGLRKICYYGILGSIIVFSGTPQTFIYFQF
jgi:hypothetical protein